MNCVHVKMQNKRPQSTCFVSFRHLHHSDQATAGEIAAAAPRLTYKRDPADPPRLGGVNSRAPIFWWSKVHSFWSVIRTNFAAINWVLSWNNNSTKPWFIHYLLNESTITLYKKMHTVFSYVVDEGSYTDAILVISFQNLGIFVNLHICLFENQFEVE